MSIDFRENIPLPTPKVVALYQSVGWTSYSRDPIGLKSAIHNSSYVVSAWHDDALVGLARCLSDDVHIVYLQDILVDPDHQGQAIGKRLMKAVFKRYSSHSTIVLLTDNQTVVKQFYEGLGMSDVSERNDLTALSDYSPKLS